MNLLFAVFDDDPASGMTRLTPEMRERLLVFGAIIVVIAAIVSWAILFRRARRRAKRRDERRRRHKSFASRTVKGVSELKHYFEEKHRRRHRKSRPRNPTLAETGGLPPVRSETPPGTGNSIPPH